MMPAVTDQVSRIMQQRSGFEKHARLRRQTVHRLQLVEELKTQLAHVLRVLLIVFQPARKTTRPNEQLTGSAVVAVRLFARERFVREFLQNSLAHADPRNGKKAEI